MSHADRKFVFSVSSPDRTLIVSTETNELMLEWISLLEKSIGQMDAFKQKIETNKATLETNKAAAVSKSSKVVISDIAVPDKTVKEKEDTPKFMCRAIFDKFDHILFF